MASSILHPNIPWTDDAKNGRREQRPVVVAHGKDDAAARHHDGAQGQDGFPAQPVRHQRQRKADAHIADQRQRHEQADARLGDAQRLQIQHQHQRRRAVREEAHEALQAQQLDVPFAAMQRHEAQLREDPREDPRACGRFKRWVRHLFVGYLVVTAILFLSVEQRAILYSRSRWQFVLRPTQHAVHDIFTVTQRSGEVPR